MGDPQDHNSLPYATPDENEPLPWGDLAKAIAVPVVLVAGVPAAVLVACYVWKVFNC